VGGATSCLKFCEWKTTGGIWGGVAHQLEIAPKQQQMNGGKSLTWKRIERK